MFIRDYHRSVLSLSLSVSFSLSTHAHTCHVSSSLTSYCCSISGVPGGTLKSCLAKLTLGLLFAMQRTLCDVIYELDSFEKHYWMYIMHILMSGKIMCLSY